MSIEETIISRTELLLGQTAMQHLGKIKIIVFGAGGVGSWCAESLVRSGVRHLTIVDSDRICITNINRQIMATLKTVGMVKVDALKERLLQINPDASIDARQQIFTEDTAESFHLEEYDYIIDAIDSIKDKAVLIQRATRTRARFFSSMGAALKIDPTRIQVAEFLKVKGCPLARALRRYFKNAKLKPAHKFLCVFSDELLKNKGYDAACGTEYRMYQEAKPESLNHDTVNRELHADKAQINGSLVHITGIFGFTLAGLVLQDATRTAEEKVSRTAQNDIAAAL